MAKLVFKVVIVGDPAVGKTSIRRKYLGETTLKEYIYTIGADFATKRVKLSEDLIVQYQIFDLAGQQKFDKVRSSFYAGAQAAILVYDITNKETLTNLPKWVMEAKRNSNGSLDTFVVVGNKLDLKDNKQTDDVSLNKFLKELSKEMNHEILHIYTSALTGENIEHLFRNITNVLLDDAAKESENIKKIVNQLRKDKNIGETADLLTSPVKVEKETQVKVLPLDKRIEQMELELNHLKLEIKEIQADVQINKDILMKYLFAIKKFVDELDFKE
ncbi:MAG: Rab family GTPase [Candidatus Thorarchaeota archaeon]